jgi:hypothetical protein
MLRRYGRGAELGLRRGAGVGLGVTVAVAVGVGVGVGVGAQVSYGSALVRMLAPIPPSSTIPLGNRPPCDKSVPC